MTRPAPAPRIALPIALAMGLAACNPPEPPPYVEEDEAGSEVYSVPAETPETGTAPTGSPQASEPAPVGTATPPPATMTPPERPGANIYGGEDEGAPAPPN